MDTQFTLRLKYTLKSTDTARLSVQIAQFPGNPSSRCAGSSNTPDATGIPISSDQHEATVQVIWHGGSSKGPPPDEGYIAPRFSFWQSNARELISRFPVLEAACYRFSR
ncbi:hypothetical protein PQR71_07585 [Paraburkholderia fungorum]|uniref:hypothetical protein n=1 Tax=Paraburkholderia fungorum TaxID=134537 RepID=UPI0038BC3115